MGTITLKTNMTCESCVSKVRPALEAKGISNALRFDVGSPDKTVQFNGTEAQRAQAISVLESLGYKAGVFEQINFIKIYKPLILVGAFLLGITALVEVNAGFFNPMRAMNVFMGGFFIFFSFFKLLDLGAFADAFATYDVVAKKFKAYGLLYPFIELALGIGFILNIFPIAINVSTVVLMAVGNIGIWRALQKKQAIQCACLGTIFKLPMTKVALFENTLMLVMALLALTWNTFNT